MVRKLGVNGGSDKQQKKGAIRVHVSVIYHLKLKQRVKYAFKQNLII